MIVAAGLGTRLRPLTDLRPKPALPVRGIPQIAYTLALLQRHGVEEAVVNTHHLPDVLEETVRTHCPHGLRVRFSREETLLDTGGGIRRVADFLRESDPCLIVGGDMLLDADLTGLVAGHRERRDAFTFLLREDARQAEFGSVGVDAEGRVRRIGSRHDFGGSQRAGIYTWVNVVSARAFDDLPEREAFNHFEGWVAPRIAAGARDVRGDFAPCTWEPVGTHREYLEANFSPRPLAYIDPQALARASGARLETHQIVGAGAKIGSGASLERVVVWDDEQVPAGLRARNGTFAGGRFHPCDLPTKGSAA